MSEPVRVGELLPGVLGELVDRVGKGYERWAELVAQAGYCHHPIRLAGRVEHADRQTGEIRTVYDSEREPDGVLLKACGTRRESRCPSCAATYRADAYQLLAAGLKGGKGVPESVAAHPRLFVTFTAPSFGKVHTREVGLRVKRVDLLHSRITVAEQATEIDGQFTWGPPKTEAGRRTVTLPAVAAAALAEHLAAYSQPGPDGLVFTSTEGGLLRRSNFNRRVWRPATQAVGVEGLRFHDLRHTSATLSIAAGASTRELMARMGHSSSAAALRYQHVMAGRDAAIAAALDELIEAASTLAERPASASSGTRVARIRQSGSGKKRR